MRFLPQTFVYKMLAIGGGIVFLGAVTTAILGLSARFWPIITAQVVSESVEKISSADTMSDSYTPVVQYKYIIDNQVSYGSRFIFGDNPSFGELQKAQSWLNNYRAQNTIKVRYFPLIPSISTITPGFSSSIFIPGFVGLMFYFVSFILNSFHLNAKKPLGVPVGNKY